MRKLIWLGIGIACLFAGWVAFDPLVPHLKIVHPIRGTGVKAVYATGSVEPVVMIPIAPKVAAHLMEIGVEEGARVTKGQILARLEDADMRQVLAQAQSRETLARMQFERTQSLIRQNSASQQALDQTRTDWEVARSLTHAAQIKIDDMALRAPEEGQILKKDGEIGQFIPVSQPVFWMSCCGNKLRVTAEVDEEDIALVKEGQEVIIHADAFPGQIFRAQVSAITPKGDPVARSYRVRLSFMQEVPLQIGMTIEANIIVDKKEGVILVPNRAIDQGKVWLVKEGRLSLPPISLGIKGETRTVVEQGLTEADEVVLSPTSSLKPGRRVNAALVEMPTP